MVRPLLVIGGLTALAAIASDAQAQDRRGFWIGFGVSAGSGSCTQIDPLGDPRCSTARKLGPSGYVSAGGTMSQQVILGVELNGWMSSSPDTVRQYGVISAIVQAFPSRNLPLYVKGGLGVGRYAEDSEGESLLSAAGFSYLIGAGMEIPLRRSMALTPFVHFVLAPQMRAKLGRLNDLQDPLDYNLLHLGIGVHWR